MHNKFHWDTDILPKSEVPAILRFLPLSGRGELRLLWALGPQQRRALPTDSPRWRRWAMLPAAAGSSRWAGAPWRRPRGEASGRTGTDRRECDRSPPHSSRGTARASLGFPASRCFGTVFPRKGVQGNGSASRKRGGGGGNPIAGWFHPYSQLRTLYLTLDSSLSSDTSSRSYPSLIHSFESSRLVHVQTWAHTEAATKDNSEDGY